MRRLHELQRSTCLHQLLHLFIVEVVIGVLLCVGGQLVRLQGVSLKL